MMTASARRGQGRYSDINRANSPGDHLAPEGRRGKMHIVHGAVQEPNAALRLPPKGSGRQMEPIRQRVAINAHVDVLETEHAYKRISNEAYRAGRKYQDVLESSRGRRSGGMDFEPKSRVDVAQAHELNIVRQIAKANRAVEMLSLVRSHLGRDAEILLSTVIGDGLTLGEMVLQREAANRGAVAGFVHKRRKLAAEFREALEDLAVVWHQRGYPF